MSLDWLKNLLHDDVVQHDLAWVAGLIVASLVAFVVVKRLLLRVIRAALQRTRNSWDDTVYRHGVFDTIAWLAPALIVYTGVERFPAAAPLVRKLVVIYVVLNAVVLVHKLLGAFLDIYDSYEVSRKRPLKGYVQVVAMVSYIVGGITALSLLLDQSPWGLLGGLGAMTAVLLLIFRDTILSFIASIQIASYDMVRIGDWIEMPKYGADGDVVDIGLHTVKVQNWDKTIVTIPTCRFIEDSFKNWRGMSEAGGRRIMRSILLDQGSIRFLDDAQLEELDRVAILAPHLRAKRAEVAAYNAEHDIDPSVPVNGRRMTNIGTFRAYVVAYLRQHPRIASEMTFLVRQLEPTASGLPLQIYVFTNTTAWVEYEGIQSDVFDHLLAAVPQFGLRVFQSPSGHDVHEAGHALARAR